MHRAHPALGLSYAVLMLLVAGCASGPIAPKFIDQTFVPASVDEIVLLSFADVRQEKNPPFDLADFMDSTLRMGPIRRQLERKGYRVTFAPDFGQVRAMTEDDITAADAAWVQSLGPQNARWVLLVALKDLSMRTTFGKAATCQCLGVLYDKPAGKAVWYHEVLQEFGHMGPLAMLITDAAWAKDTLAGCIMLRLFKEFPPKE